MKDKLRVMGVSNFTLFCIRCKCGEVTVHGFWNQLKKKVDFVKKAAWVEYTCSACGHVRTKRFRLTTAPYRTRRLAPWIEWLAYLWWIRPSIFRRLVPIAWWLEKRLPI